eukprot:CAMPEP_0178929948 /NCGR_PEP_ID=MMETSP0786-20121207/20937_1 /TAXON_ID=186022 /ORGANISM="Thalassionema frauenfeldii, Strain CCMP 1798" /LENGTH=372 /DNA_ID=CAMNT_0020606369 /DNA_START=1554 /DNA_END=2669 /DNA_ORIENTATION=+
MVGAPRQGSNIHRGTYGNAKNGNSFYNQARNQPRPLGAGVSSSAFLSRSSFKSFHNQTPTMVGAPRQGSNIHRGTYGNAKNGNSFYNQARNQSKPLGTVASSSAFKRFQNQTPPAVGLPRKDFNLLRGFCCDADIGEDIQLEGLQKISDDENCFREACEDLECILQQISSEDEIDCFREAFGDFKSVLSHDSVDLFDFIIGAAGAVNGKTSEHIWKDANKSALSDDFIESLKRCRCTVDETGRVKYTIEATKAKEDAQIPEEGKASQAPLVSKQPVTAKTSVEEYVATADAHAATSENAFSDTDKKENQAVADSPPLQQRFLEPSYKEYVEPTDRDVLFGRGGKVNKHLGNQAYLIKVLECSEFYRMLTDKD